MHLKVSSEKFWPFCLDLNVVWNQHIECLYVCNVGYPGGCFINVSWAPQNNLPKMHNTGNHIHGENLNMELCTCAQSMALGTRTKFHLQILIRTTISAIHKFQENILESSRNVSETPPGLLKIHWLTGVSVPIFTPLQKIIIHRSCPAIDLRWNMNLSLLLVLWSFSRASNLISGQGVAQINVMYGATGLWISFKI